MTDASFVGIPEKLGSFYLGSGFDLEKNAVVGPQLHYDARDLTTHAVCVGMTGSGKTGLCVGLLEEAAIDQIPAIIIDPKGDMGNLLLHFPELRPQDFGPWINEDDARRKAVSVDEFAVTTSALWRKGLAEWGITPDRIHTLSRSVEYAVYTPGSESVRPVNVLGSLRVPPSLDAEAMRENITGTVGALLGLVGVDADPVKSQEAILLSVLFEHFWSNGQDVDLGLLVRSVQDPPVRKFGVFDVDSFLPAQGRFELAMALNNLMASPSFAAWLSGSPLDIDALLYRPDGTPKHSVFYIAHLSEPERMFFVTLLLNAVVAWMRRQPGTTSLRALLYFDEVFGFLPPVAMPPSKRPLLTILKQARAYGLGAVLVTQNPVDLDYKALSNAGTWFIGRLQSKQDQQRLLEGLKTASATDDASAAALANSVGQLKNRVFIMNNVHNVGPVTFHTRWAMNYLRGPMTRAQLQRFVQPRGQEEPPAARPAPEPASPSSGGSSARPVLPPGLSERFLADLPGAAGPPGRGILYRSAIGALVSTHFIHRKHDLKVKEQTLHIIFPADAGKQADWARAAVAIVPDNALSISPAYDDMSFVGGLPAGCTTQEDAKSLGRKLVDWVYDHRRASFLYNDDLDILQQPGETDAAFQSRLALAAREQRDAAIDQIGERFQKQLDRIEDRRETVSRSLSEQEELYSARKQEELFSLGETVLGIVLGRRRRLSTVATKRRMTGSARAKMETLEAKEEELKAEMLTLQAEAESKAAEITRAWDAVVKKVARYEIEPRRTDVSVVFVGVLWLPYVVDSDRGVEIPAFSLG